MEDNKPRPAFVRFERRVCENHEASKQAGQFVGKDVDYALVTAPGTRDVYIVKASQWLENIKQEMNGDRLPREFYEHYVKMYEAWKNDEELPLNGSPIKGWGVISPAQQETLIRMHILTVEDLAASNDEALHRIGMGAVTLRDKARAWIAQLSDRGPLTQEISALKLDNRNLKASNESLMRQIEGMKETLSMLERQSLAVGMYGPAAKIPSSEEISLSDLIDPEPEANKQIPTRPRGRPKNSSPAP